MDEQPEPPTQPPLPPINPYDQIPYESHPYPQASPDRLHVIASLMGLSPPNPASARTLELGCCSGHHLIALAARFPNAQFLGIDYSQSQIAQGQQTIAALNLPNIRLEHHDILNLPDLGQFDFIISHGVFSWVPPPVQNKILAIMSQNLAPHGIAYVSYNVLPGWHSRGIIRDMLLFRARQSPDAPHRLRNARGLVNFLVDNIPPDKNPYGLFLRRELELLQNKDDDYFFHEHLESHNQPFYFHQFMQQAAAHSLQFVGESNFSVMSATALKPPISDILQSISRDRIETEQYFDFLHNRMFRQTLLCHANLPAGQTVSQTPLPKNLLPLFIASPLKPEIPTLDPRMKEEATFRSPKALAKATEPLMKAALLTLADLWPRSISLSDLIATARSRLSDQPSLLDPTQATADSLDLAAALLRLYANAQIEISTHPSHFTLTISDRPVACPLARLQAQNKSQNQVTTMRHEVFTLSDLQRCLLPLLDGTRDRPALLTHLTNLVSSNQLILRQAGQPLTDPAQIRPALEAPLTTALSQFARAALLSS